MSFALPYMGVPPTSGPPRAPAGAETRLNRMPARAIDDEAGRARARAERAPQPRAAALGRPGDRRARLRQPRGARPGRCSSACSGFRADGHDFARRRRRRRGGRAGRRAPARPRRARGAGGLGARARWRRWRRASTASPRSELRRGRRHGHERQDDDAPTSSRALLEAGGQAVRPARHGQVGDRRAASGRWRGRRPRRSTSRPTCARCSTAATAPARWRSPRTRCSSGAPTRSRSRRRSSRTSPRTTSTSTRHGGLLPGQAEAVRGRRGPRRASASSTSTTPTAGAWREEIERRA